MAGVNSIDRADFHRSELASVGGDTDGDRVRLVYFGTVLGCFQVPSDTKFVRNFYSEVLEVRYVQRMNYHVRNREKNFLIV